MLVISIPNGETEGKCKINGKPCEFTIEGGTFAFRPAGCDEAWDRRKILQAIPGPKLTNYACGSRSEPDGPPAAPLRADHAELRQLVDANEPMLRDVWSLHKRDDDIMVLGDVRRSEVAEMCKEQWEKGAVDKALDHANRTGSRPMLACLQPPRFVDILAGDGDWAHRETAKELRMFASQRKGGFGVVPLLVAYPGGLWATMWSEPGSNTAVVRYEPAAVPESN
jgi:hypothetical protein